MAEVKINPEQQYPSNSIVSKPSASPKEPEKREKVDSVVRGKVSLKKESFSEKLKKTFLPGDIQDIKSYAWNQIIVPGLKTSAIAIMELALFGQVSSRSRNGYFNANQSNQRTNYTYISSGSQRGVPIQPTISNRDRSMHNFRGVVFENLEDVEDVISTLLDIVERTGYATVADYYDACGIQAEWADETWGWKGFQRLESRRTRDGYVIDMTPPIQLR